MGEALVAVRLPFDAAFTTTIDAAWEAGDAVLPVHPDLPDPEVEALLATLRPGFLVDASGIHRLPGAEAVEPGTALVVPTSGTTGRPKGVVLTHDNLSASALATATRLELGEGDRWLCCVPPSHIAGLMVLVRARLTGADAVLHPRFDPAAIAGEDSTNVVSLVPTMLRRLLQAGVDVARFRWILLGGGPVPAALVAAATEAGARVVATYGMTETCSGVVYDGVPLPGVRVAVGEDGSIALSGPMVMRGYRLRPDETAAVLRDGWFHTSDAGEVDPSGRLRVLGRRDDLIITGGQKVLPVEVVSLLLEHPDVADAAVAGRPDDQWGQAVAAVVVPAPGSMPTLAALRAFVAERLAAYKAPRYLVIVEELPRGPTGKPVGLDALVAGPSAVSS
ncbi:MAG TPA: fatty acid--CoA ligase family protein [Actinomycetota bacterium]